MTDIIGGSRFLVTGGAGFIGSAFVGMLVRAGADVMLSTL